MFPLRLTGHPPSRGHWDDYVSLTGRPQPSTGAWDVSAVSTGVSNVSVILTGRRQPSTGACEVFRTFPLI